VATKFAGYPSALRTDAIERARAMSRWCHDSATSATFHVVTLSGIQRTEAPPHMMPTSIPSWLSAYGRAHLAALLVLGLAGCMQMECGNEIVQTVASPSGVHKAVVFRRDCGATTGFTTQLSIIAADDSLPDDAGNLLIADDLFPISIRWLSARRVEIAASPPSRVYKQRVSVDGVVASYVPARSRCTSD
jgi:hypothetical protein